jgi:hypothetical protein
VKSLLLATALMVLGPLVLLAGLLTYAASWDQAFARECSAAGGHVYDPYGWWSDDAKACLRDGLVVEIYP